MKQEVELIMTVKKKYEIDLEAVAYSEFSTVEKAIEFDTAQYEDDPYLLFDAEIDSAEVEITPIESGEDDDASEGD